MDFFREQFSRLSTFLSAPIYHGLTNQGATCYLNSVLQVLFMTRDFREAVERSLSDDPKCIDHQLKDLFDDLKRYTAYTFKITNRLGIDRVYEQQDAAEYLEKILALTSEEASKIFHGELTHKTTCSKCLTDKNTNGKFWHLPLELGRSYSETYHVVDGIEEYFKELSFTEENRVYCNECDDKSDATTKYTLKDPPEVLTLLLKRFAMNYYDMSYIKNNCAVDVPCSLHIPESHMYELYAVVDHWGDLRIGHYTAKVKSQDDDRWYEFDDTRVRLLEPQMFKRSDIERSHTAYLLFYMKKKTQAADTCAHDTMDTSTSGFLPNARVRDDQSRDAETGGETEEEKTEVGEDAAELVSIDRCLKQDMVSVESRPQQLSPEHICPVEHQDSGDGVGQRGQNSDQGRNEERSEMNNQDAPTNKLEPTGADQLTPATTKLWSKYDLFLEGVQSSGSAADHKHNMPEDEGGFKQGGSEMLYKGCEQQREDRRDEEGDKEQSKADDDPAQRKEALTTNPQSQESADLKEVVLEGKDGRRICGRIIEEEFEETPHGLQRCSERKTIAIVTVQTSTEVTIRSQEGDGGRSACSQLNDSLRPEQQTHRGTIVSVNAKEINCTSHSSTRETQKVSEAQMQAVGIKYAKKKTRKRRKKKKKRGWRHTTAPLRKLQKQNNKTTYHKSQRNAE